MKYFNIAALNRSIERIVDGNITHEHRTGTAAFGLARHYFTVDKFGITAEQIQPASNKRPDLSIEKFSPIHNDFFPHTYIEVKSLVGKNIADIVDQLSNAITEALDYHGNNTGHYSSFAIAVKGTKIAFYIYHNFASLLDDYGIPNDRGFIPLTYYISEDDLLSINHSNPFLGMRYRNSVDFTTDSSILRQLGVQSTRHIEHPHVFDLLNVQHREDIHKLFTFVQQNDPNLFIAD